MNQDEFGGGCKGAGHQNGMACIDCTKPRITVLGTISGTNYLNVCAHCGECLKQLTSYPYKLNVVVSYRDEKGDIVEWKPEQKEDK